MASILDHVVLTVSRATVYGTLRGTNVFVGKYFRELYPSSNANVYDPKNSREIKIIVASPSKTSFFDMRSAYLKFQITDLLYVDARMSEPAGTAWIKRVVIKCNGAVIEDINHFSHLTALFKRKILTRAQKNAHPEEGWYTIKNSHPCFSAADRALAGNNDKRLSKTDSSYCQHGNNSGEAVGKIKESKNLLPGDWMVYCGKAGAVYCAKLDLSGVMNMQTLVSGYYAPLEISIFIDQSGVCMRAGEAITANVATQYKITNPRLCIDEIVVTPQYTAAFEAALVERSSSNGVQMSFDTYSVFTNPIGGGGAGSSTFWLRQPVRYLRGVY